MPAAGVLRSAGGATAPPLEPVHRLPDDAQVTATRAALACLFGPPEERSFAVELWDGTIEHGATAEPRFTLILRHPGSLRRMLFPPNELRASEAFLRGEVDVRGDLEAATGLSDGLAQRFATPRGLARVAGALARIPPGRAAGRAPRRYLGGLSTRLHFRRADRDAVRFHYDLGNEFYRLWLDAQMVYSCAYFHRQQDDLATAQRAKLDYICRKLRLSPGERLLDIGCGWGGLVWHATRHYGVQAVGITLSEHQAEFARARLADSGLADRCRILVRDYRDLPEGETFDKVVSVGMVEHVGRGRLSNYFAQAYRATRQGGLFLSHGIVELRRPPRPSLAAAASRLVWRPGMFIERHVFPGAWLYSPAQVVAEAETAGFETRDVESLREHYALTLRHWLGRLEQRTEEAVAMVGTTTYRAWRLYLAGCARRFAAGQLGLLQALFAKPSRGSAGLPLTRADLYR
jgi:cyclopropane-fatty-acyl-phospholipid synthase